MSLRPVPFRDLLLRMKHEVEASDAIFDLPVRKWWVPDSAYDFSAMHFGRKASTPVGPAAGPHTQLAQNIVLSWLGGARIIELKTVQVNDELEIPRPCIHAPNVGLNVEWSQELKIDQSVREYAKAAFLIEILKQTQCFGRFPSNEGLETVFDTSVGYDLAGIKSGSVTGFLNDLRSGAHLFDELRGELDGELAVYRDTELSDTISDCVTLSTFHGCPADEIEAITRYLIEELGFNAIVKLNPTLLGFDRVRELLVDRLGYTRYQLKREAFEADLKYEDALGILTNLRTVAEDRGSIVGAKFTNTLVVANDESVFPTQSDPYMYVSGPPLHVISMNLMQMVREDVGFDFPVSFSAGIDARNFPDAVACGMVPITTCTDLLRKGGYGRLPAYLKALAREMDKLGVTSREAYVLAATGQASEAFAEAFLDMAGRNASREQLDRIAATSSNNLPVVAGGIAGDAGLSAEKFKTQFGRVAGRFNGRQFVPTLEENPRYQAAANSKAPRMVDSELALYDCLNCDICIAVCPNDAFFSYDVAPGDGVAEEHQLAFVDDFCNECSNCEIFCPENGAPFKVKERVFATRSGFEESTFDGFWYDGNKMFGRVEGILIREDGDVEGTVGERLRRVRETIYESSRPNPVKPEGVGQ